VVNTLFSQSTFEFIDKKEKTKIPFDLLSNLVVIPVKVNGVELSFLLDTGVKETIIFNVNKVDSLSLNKAEVYNIKGVNDVEVVALKSKNNILEVGDIKSSDQVIYVAFNQESNISSYLGEEIHGILGYHFFKDFVIEFAYDHEFIKVYKKGFYKNKWNRFKEVDLSFYNGKPYIDARLENDVVTRFLLDTGMSDGLWMFKEDLRSINDFGYYEDYLGMTVSGEIIGKRSKIQELNFVGQTFKNVKISYPHTNLLFREIKEMNNRSGNIGGELLRRFTIVFDYSNSKMYMKPNRFIDDPFHYNKSGIILKQDGQAVAENSNLQLFDDLQHGKFISYSDLSYMLSPEFIIDYVREDSPAALAGIVKNDVLLEINGSKTYKYSLKTINALFYDKENKKIKIKLQRGDQILDKIFYLKSPLKKRALVLN
jgi:hypothetical protein